MSSLVRLHSAVALLAMVFSLMFFILGIYHYEGMLGMTLLLFIFGEITLLLNKVLNK